MAESGLKSGVSIDPLTLEPLEQSLAEKDFEKQQRDETMLREQAEFLNVTFSAEGRHLIDVISKQLEARIEQLIEADPEATAYAKLLRRFGHKETMARLAVKKLYKRQFEDKP